MSEERSSNESSARPSLTRRSLAALRRHPYWLAFVLLVVAVRVALPYVLRPVLEDQISAQLNGRIEIQDVDLSLLRGEAVVEGVRIYEGESSDVVSFAKLLANVGWTALPFGQAVVEEIHLLSPRVLVVREQDGTINLTRLPAATEAAEEEKPTEEEESGSTWPAGLTRLALEDATVTFRDQTVEGFEDLDFHVDRLEVQRAAYGGPIYEENGKVTLVAEIAGAPLKIEADFDSEIGRQTSTGNVSIHGLDVGLGSPYTAQLLGWSRLSGTLDIDLDFAAESGDAESPRVLLALRDFLITVEGEDQPALKWDSLTVEIDELDPEDLFVRIAELRLSNLGVRLRPAEEQPLVLLSRMESNGEAQEPEEAETSESDEEPAAFRWELAKLIVEGAHVLVEAPEKTLDAELNVELAGLTSEPGSKADVKLATAVEGGKLDLGGVVSIAPPGFDGKVTLADLPLPAVLAVAPEPRAKIVRGGIARTDLDVSVLVEEESGVAATVAGGIGLAGLNVADEDPKRFSLTWEDLDIAIDGVDIRDGAPAAGDGKAPIRIASISLKKPAFHGVRLEDGSIAMPKELSSRDGAPEPADREEVAESEPAPDETGSPMPGIELAKLRLTDGSLQILDRAVQPHAKPGLKKLDVSLDGVHMPERRIEQLAISGTGLRGGKLKGTGKVAGEETDVLITIDKYRLVPYDPYAVTFSGYGIRRGMLTVESKIRLQGDNFDTHTNVIVHQLGLKNTTGTTEFEDQIGVPLNLALALLKDTQGNIVLDVPVSGNSRETNIGIAGIIGQQLRRILINALTSPLKLFGAGSGGDAVGDFSSVQIGFAEGGASLSPEGREQVEKLAALLRDRPELAIHLDVRNSLDDVRALQEEILLAELRQRESIDGDLETIRDYLEERSSGEQAELPYHLQPILDEILSHRRPSEAQLRTLSSSRAAIVRDVLTTELQVRAEQVLVEEHLGTGLTDGPAVVEAELGVVESEEDLEDLEDLEATAGGDVAG